MAKTETPKTGTKVATANTNVETLKPKPTIVATTKTAVTETIAAVTKVVKDSKPKRADRDGCKAKRVEIHPLDIITPTGKTNDARQGSLRYNIVEAVITSATVKAACSKEVNGATGTKHEKLPYRVKLVDVGFVVGNGFATTRKPE